MERLQLEARTIVQDLAARVDRVCVIGGFHFEIWEFGSKDDTLLH